MTEPVGKAVVPFEVGNGNGVRDSMLEVTGLDDGAQAGQEGVMVTVTVLTLSDMTDGGPGAQAVKGGGEVRPEAELKDVGVAGDSVVLSDRLELEVKLGADVEDVLSEPGTRGTVDAEMLSEVDELLLSMEELDGTGTL